MDNGQHRTTVRRPTSWTNEGHAFIAFKIPLFIANLNENRCPATGNCRENETETTNRHECGLRCNTLQYSEHSLSYIVINIRCSLYSPYIYSFLNLYITLISRVWLVISNVNVLEFLVSDIYKTIYYTARGWSPSVIKVLTNSLILNMNHHEKVS